MEILLHTETTIDSAHQLKGYNGKCSNQHGHTWFLDLFIKGEETDLDKDGILFDFGKVKEIKDLLDHKFLNDNPYFDIDKGGVNPTAENISLWIYHKLKEMNNRFYFKIRLYETKIGKETWCEVGDF